MDKKYPYLEKDKNASQRIKISIRNRYESFVTKKFHFIEDNVHQILLV